MPCVVRSIVPSDLCVGCGVCASICPQNILGIRFNKYGEYESFLKEDCQKECGLCYNVCPFGNDNPNEDEIGQRLFGSIQNIHHDPTTGYHLASFVGSVASEPQRERSASGGLATWILTTLLTKNSIDAAICVSPTNETDMLFKYSVMRDRAGVEASSGSAYYPVQLSDVLSYIINTPGRYAITALPCFAKGIRLAQMRSEILRERILFVIGITCGQMKSKHYTDYLAAETGVKGKIIKAHYRGKDKNHNANNYYYYCENNVGEKGKIFLSGVVWETWSSRMFTLNPCNYCDDIFAECADIVCMDAWLPEYVSEWRGTSLILIRKPYLLELLREGSEKGDIDLTHVPINSLKQSQKGLVVYKRQELKTRLWIAERDGMDVPAKRVSAKRNVNLNIMIRTRILKEIQHQSKERYLERKEDIELDPALFRRSISSYQKILHILQKASVLSDIVLAAINSQRRSRKY